MAPLFITLEGIDGCGKTTQAKKLADALSRTGGEVVLLREPGGTAISERIRELLLDPENAGMSPECELLLYEASRAQLVREVIKPALERGAVVVCDRFYDSTYAYQHGGRGLSAQLVKASNELGSCGVVPTCTVVFDIDPKLALARATKGGADRMEAEGLAFQQRIRDAYLQLAASDKRRLIVVDASGTPDEVYDRLVGALAETLPAPMFTEEP
jgi:dTMP kinase